MNLQPRGKPAVFLDRDGTLMEEVDYCNDPAKVRILTGVAEGLARLRELGFLNIIITNQSGIGRGRITPEQYRQVHAALMEKIGGDSIDATYFCPHAPEAGCECRKPLTGMVRQAGRERGIDLAKSWFIGDKASDMECGRSAGTRTILVQTGYGGGEAASGADYVVPDFCAAARLIVQMTEG